MSTDGIDEKYPLALPKGTILAGQYVIDHALGQGGFGITYMATDHSTGQKVAVKEFFPDTMATRTQTTVTAFSGERGESFAYGKTCFLQEAETLAEFIGNENIVRIHSYFEENGTAYFVMDFVEGISFDRYIREHGGRVDYEEAERILVPVMDALAAVHGRGIVHRDVTPDNIYITKDGTVKLLDFGAARYSLGDKSRSLDVVLKHGFAPKEQYTRHGRQGPFTDVYTVGASFYFAITGRRPTDSIDRLEEDDLIPPSRLGVAISSAKEEAILKAMNVQPSERFQTMGEFKQALLSEGDAAAESGRTRRAYVQQRFFTPSQTPVQPQQPAQPHMPAPASDGTGDFGAVRKKKWILPAGIGAAAVILTAVIVAAVSMGGRTSERDKEAVHYNIEENNNVRSGGDSGSNANRTEEEGTGMDMGSRTEEPDSTPPVVNTESDTVETESAFVEILGNTSNNLINRGEFVYDGETIFYADMGGNGLLYDSGGGEVEILDEEGFVCCISVVGDKIYYLNNLKACRVNRDGTDKELIPELSGYEKIDRLFVSEDYYYILLWDVASKSHTLQCIGRNTGEEAGSICSISDTLKYITFLNGYVYYLLDSGDDGRELWRVPADALSSEPELLLGPDDIHKCHTIVSEGQYIYGFCEVLDNGEVQDSNFFFQYDVNMNEIVRTRAFTESVGRFGEVNVCGQYLYFSNDDEQFYRFKAEPGDDPLDMELVYANPNKWLFLGLSTFKEKQSIVLEEISYGYIVMNLDGSGEHVISEYE